jgi:uncharacterized protein YggE
MKTSILAAAIAVAMAAPAALPAQTPAAVDARFAATTLDVSAYGEVSVAPDMATIRLGVTTQGGSAAKAMGDNAAAMNRVVGALRAGGIEARDIQTSNLSLEPQYAYAQGQEPRLTGYEASNQVAVTVRDLTRLGSAVDAVVNAGATNVGSIEFGLMSSTPAENAARLTAVKALEDKAGMLADASGYRIRRLVNLTESGGEAGAPPPPRPLMMAARAEAAPPPTEPGEIKVRVDVTGEFELAR